MTEMIGLKGLQALDFNVLTSSQPIQGVRQLKSLGKYVPKNQLNHGNLEGFEGYKDKF